MNQHSRFPVTAILPAACAVLIGLAGAGLAIAVWRATDRNCDQHAQLLEEQRRYHDRSLAEFERLATNAGLRTCADLCPVTFRVRNDHGHTVPVVTPLASLAARSESGFEPVVDMPSLAHGVYEFGLNPPGDYRLTLLMSDGMRLQHDFKVLPGVPLDRLVLMPRPSDRAELVIQAGIDWPTALEETPLIALCRFEPATAVCGEWKWTPREDWQAVTAVTTNGDASWTDEGLMVAALRCEADVCPADAVAIPYEYAQLTRIDFLTSTSSQEQDGRLIDLATVSFTDAGGSPGFDSDWTLVATPRFERVKPNWRVALPEQVAVGLQARLRQLPHQTTVDRRQPADSAESQPGG